MAFLVMFSSISSIIGSRGQCNYAAGDTFQDALAIYRVSIGGKGSALELGVFLLLESSARFEAASVFNPVAEAELSALLDYYCNAAEQHCTRMHYQTVAGVGMTAGIRARGLDKAYWLKKPSFRQVVIGEARGESGAVIAEHVNFQEVFATASSLEEAVTAVTAALVKKLAKTLSLTPEELEPDKPMHRYGVNSLVAVELRNWFSKGPRADITIFDILGDGMLSTVRRMVASKGKYRRREWGD